MGKRPQGAKDAKAVFSCKAPNLSIGDVGRTLRKAHSQILRINRRALSTTARARSRAVCGRSRAPCYPRHNLRRAWSVNYGGIAFILATLAYWIGAAVHT